MAYPAGVVTTQLTFGTASSNIGQDALAMTVKVTPTTNLVYGGNVLIADTKTIQVAAGGSGAVTLINPDQPGFTNGFGKTIRNWGYTFDITYSSSGTALYQAPSKIITWLATDAGPLDVDTMIPVADGSGVLVPATTLASAVAPLALLTTDTAVAPLLDTATTTRGKLDARYGLSAGKNGITGWYHVKGYGAVPNDSVSSADSNSAAVQAAIAAAPAGGTIYVDGNLGDIYQVSSSANNAPALILDQGKRLRGSGAYLKAAATHDGVQIVRVTGNGSKIQGVSWSANGITNATCIYFADGTSGHEIFENTFFDCGSGGMYASAGVTNIDIHNNHFDGGLYGVLVNDGAGNATWKIVDNVFRNGAGGDAVAINGASNVHRDFIVEHNRIENWRGTSGSSSTGHGISFAFVQGGNIAGNYIRGCDRNGIHVEAYSRHVGIDNNWTYDCQNAGIEVQGGGVAGDGTQCSHISITNNHVVNCAIATSVVGGHLSNGGIDIGATNTTVNTGGGAFFITVTGNHVDGCRSSGIWLQYVAYGEVSRNFVTNTYGNSNDPAVANNSAYYIAGATSVQFDHNQAIDSRPSFDSGSPTQYYPLAFIGTMVTSAFLLNVRAGNISANDCNPPAGVS
jgi:hypothetical protein